MSAFYVTSISGFFTAFLVGFTVCLPFLLRRRARRQGRQANFGLHFCVGYAILIVLLVHMMVSMQAGMARGTSLVGLDLATLALLLVMMQVALGVTLMKRPDRPRALRAMHLLVMGGIVVLAGVHIALNSVLLRSLLGV